MFSYILLAITSPLVIVLYTKNRMLRKERDRLLEENKEDSKVLFLKSRYTSMGETLGNIAHQWKQPLNAIGTIQNGIKAALIFQGEISKEKLLNSVETSFKLLQHLSETIDTFYSFLAQRGDNKMSFIISEELEKVRKITEYSFENSKILLTFELDVNLTIRGNANEFTHAILNLILNAKDALDDANVKNPMIKVQVFGKEKTCVIMVSDNAGGIRVKPLNMVFDLHITTKENGSGLGLFMTKNIIENRFGGKILVKNNKKGACFTILLPYEEYSENHNNIITVDEKLTLERINQLSHKIIELEEVEKALKKWADIFKHAHWAIAIHVGTNNTFELTNTAFQTLYGYTATEFKTLSIPELFAPKSLPFLAGFQKEAFEKGYITFESVHKRKDGSTFPVSVELIIIKDEEGEVLYHMANIWDLSEKKVAEEKLWLQKFALDHIKDAVFMVDEKGNFQYVNEGACKSLGYTSKEMLSMNVGDVDPDLPKEKWGEDWEMLKYSKSMTMELRHQRKDGNIFPVEVSANFIEFGGKQYNMGIARDITERKLLEQQKDNERLRLFFERQLVGMAIVSPDKKWLQTNQKLQEMLGYTHEELEGHTCVELTYPDDIVADLELFGQLLKGEVDDYMLEKRFYRKDKTIVYTKLAVSCVRNDDCSVNYVLVLLEDITEQKHTHITLVARERELRALADSSPGMMGAFHLRSDDSMYMPYVSPNIIELFGLNPHDVREDATLLMALNHPEDAERIHTSILESAQSMSVWHEEYRIIHPTKGIRWMESNTKPEWHPDDGIVWYGYVHDITERKQIEEKLQSNRDLLHAILESSPDVITFALDTHYRYIAFDSKHANVIRTMFGKEIAIDMNMFDVIGSNDDSDVAKHSFDRALAGESFIAEEEYGDERLSRHYWQIYYAPIYSERNEIIGLTCFNMDITERKQAEEAIQQLNATLEEKVQERTSQLQQSLEFSEGVINALPDLLFELDSNGKYLNVWARDEKLLAAQKELLLENTVYDALSKEAADAVLDAMREASIEGASFGKIIKIELPDGARHFEISVSKKISSNTYIVLSHDITHRIRSEKALHQSKETFRAIVENSPDVISRYDLQMRRTYVNPLMKFLLGKSLEEILGKTPREFSPLLDIEIFEELFEIVVRIGTEVEYEGAYLTPWGEKRWGNQRILPEFDEDRNVIGVIVIGRDMTERVKTDKEAFSV